MPMEYLMALPVGGLRAAARLTASILIVVMLSAGSAAAQNNNAAAPAPNNNPGGDNPAGAPLPALPGLSGPAPVYNTSGPLFIDPEKILEAQQAAQLPPPQSIAPPEMITAELLSLSRRVGACRQGPGCSVRSRLKIMMDESNAMHEALARMDAVCSILSYDTCLYPQYGELQQWYSMNDQMRTMMQSVETAAGTGGENSMILSQQTPPAGQLNNMEPAAGNTNAGADSPACTMDAKQAITCPGTR
jgi:hypothetical protein